jgi:RNA polymerase sigma-70 factor (ECF subfamily)
VDLVDRERLEGEVRSLCRAGDHAAAVAIALRGYGPELYSFLVAMHRSQADAGDAFSELSETMWLKLPSFAWDSSLRTWAYAIAKNVSRTLKRNDGRRGRRIALATDSVLEDVAAVVRSETLPYLRTGKKTRLQALRDRLSDPDRCLLVLRVDRKLGWSELARVLGEARDDEVLDTEQLTREAARLRKRFQLVKDKLRELARREGLLD